MVMARTSVSCDQSGQQVKLGIAGVNTRPLMRAADPLLGIAGNWGSTLRPHLARIVEPGVEPGGEPGAAISKARLGDQAALHALRRACSFLDYTYLTCPDRRTGRMRYRPGFAGLCAPETRRLPLYLDSAAFREFTGGAPAWSGYARYCEAIDLVQARRGDGQGRGGRPGRQPPWLRTPVC